jgi:heme A synthase
LASDRGFGIASRLGLVTSLAIFGLIVLGSAVRTTGSGLACPDWPLCQGRIIPPFEPHVLLEWLHRTMALLVSVLVIAIAALTLSRSELRPRLGPLAGLAVALLAAQVLLGALTVWKLLDPSVVNVHLAVALLLFVTMLTLTMLAEHLERDGAAGAPTPGPLAIRSPALLPTFAFVTTLTYAQCVLGGAVSSQHAGVACPDWPRCNGEWFPALGTLAGIQMLHRAAAYALVIAMAGAYAISRSAPDAGVRAGASLALGLNLAQIVIGVCNVLLRTPAWLSPLHLATAAAMLAILVTVTFRAATLPARAPRNAGVHAMSAT